MQLFSVELWDGKCVPTEGVVLGKMMGNSGYWSTDYFWWPLLNLIRKRQDYANRKAEKKVGILSPGDT